MGAWRKGKYVSIEPFEYFPIPEKSWNEKRETRTFLPLLGGGGGHCFESEIYTCRGLGADAGAFLVQPMLTRPDLLGQSPSLGTFLLPILCVCFCVYFFHQFFCVCFFFVFRFVDLSFLLWLLGSVTVWAENQLPLMLPHIRAVNMGYSIERDLARSSQKKKSKQIYLFKNSAYSMKRISEELVDCIYIPNSW